MEVDELTNESQFNTKSICRACLETLRGTHRDIVQTPSLIEKFVACTSIAVETSDGLPSRICHPCYEKLNQFYEFREMCISSTRRCHDLIVTSKNDLTLELDIEENKVSRHLVLLKEAKQELCDENIFEGVQEFEEYDRLSATKDEHKIRPGQTIKAEKSSADEESDNDSYYGDCNICNDSDAGSTSNGSIGGDKKCSEPSKKKEKPNTKNESKKQLFQCETCKRRFQKAFMLTAHRRIHEGHTTFPCESCSKVFKKINRLRFHFRVAHESKQSGRLVCPEQGCGKSYSLQQTLKKHIKMVHSGSFVKQQFICEVCGKGLTTNAALKYHRFKHTGQQLPYKCDLCPRRFITNDKCKEHMNRHAGIRKYTCPHCGAKKSTRTELNVHVNYHTKEKTYPCRFCDKVFNNTGNMGRHIRIVHRGIKDYPCQYCDKSFGKAETRKHHEMTHTGEKPHECNICHKRFIQPVAWRKHYEDPRQGIGDENNSGTQ